MKKVLLLLSLISSLAYASTETLSLEERLEKLEQKLNELEQEKEELIQEKKQEKIVFNNDKVEMHGYFRTGADGNMREGNKRAIGTNKNLVGRWGNEFDTNFNFILSRKFTLPNQAWSEVGIKIENWNDSYDNGLDGTNLNVTKLYLEMGNLPIFTGAFKEATVMAGKNSWGSVIVDPIDYYYQDVNGTGVGIDKIKFLDGYLNLAYISADFDDETQHLYKGDAETAGTIRGYKTKYTQDDISLEIMYAHAVDHDNVGLTGEKDKNTKFSRETADDGFYAGLYYNPKNFFGLKGWGQHYLQFANGVLAGYDNVYYTGAGIGRLNSLGNMYAHKDSKAYQLGLGGLVNINEKTNMMVTFRTNYTDKADSRAKEILENGTIISSNFAKEVRQTGFNIRPIYTLNQFLDLWIDAGIGTLKTETYKGESWTGDYYKISAGPQLRYSIGFAETTIKAYVTYLEEDTTTGDRDDIITGLQFVAWW